MKMLSNVQFHIDAGSTAASASWLCHVKNRRFAMCIIVTDPALMASGMASTSNSRIESEKEGTLDFVSGSATSVTSVVDIQDYSGHGFSLWNARS